MADSQYSQVSTYTWADGNQTIEYDYNDNGSLISKITYRREGQENVYVKGLRYEYNLQNRLAEIWAFGNDEIPNTADDELQTEYHYNIAGIRTKTIDYDVSGDLLTAYLIDPANPTGYAQVLEETKYDISGASPVPLSRIQYTLGDDVISQTVSMWDSGDSEWDASATQYLLYDGHGSTRQLVNSNLTVADTYSYDGYGVMLSSGSDAAAAAGADTSLLYAGEQYDADAQQYYLRARYYNPANGVFNRVDPYSGNTQDPQSLHKYAYCHNNPVNATDPTGKFMSLGGVMAAMSIQSITYGIMMTAVGAPKFFATAVSGFTEYMSHLFKLSTWATAAKGILGAIADLISNPAKLILTILVGILAKIFVVAALAQTAWDIIGAAGALKEMFSAGLSKSQLAYFAAVTTAALVMTVVATIVIGKIVGKVRNRGGGGGTSGDANLDDVLNDPALENVDLISDPTYNPDLDVFGQATGRGYNASVEIGPSALTSRKEALTTVIHEEVHLRLDVRSARGSWRAGLKQSAGAIEEDWCEGVARRFVQMKGVQ